MKLTDAIARTLQLPPDRKDKTFFDEDLPGYGVRVRDGGARKWVVVYDGPGGATRRLTLGSITTTSAAKARAIGRDVLAAVRLGQDPAADKATARTKARSQRSETIGAILPGYLALKRGELKPRSFTEVNRHLSVYAAPLHSRPIHAVELREAALLLTKIGETRGMVTRNRARASLTAFYHWAAGEGLVATNPFANTNKAPESAPRARAPSLEELAEIWHATDDSPYGQIIKLLMLCGARRDEIAKLRWAEVDLEAGWITLPPQRVKNGRLHEIPITAPMAAILKARQETCAGQGHDSVFGRGPNGYQDFSNAKVELDARLQAARQKRNAAPMLPWVAHDFRRSVSTTMHEVLGIEPHICEACIGHAGIRIGVAAVYNRSAFREGKRRAFERWSELLMAAVTGKPIESKVVRMKRK
jgi:integrase